MFCNEFGEPCDRTGIGRYGLRPALYQAGIDKAVSMHGLRHTYASLLILLGRKIPEISRYLGPRGCFNHDESLRAFPEAQETGHYERSGEPYRVSSQKFLGTILAQFDAEREKDIIVSS